MLFKPLRVLAALMVVALIVIGVSLAKAAPERPGGPAPGCTALMQDLTNWVAQKPHIVSFAMISNDGKGTMRSTFATFTLQPPTAANPAFHQENVANYVSDRFYPVVLPTSTPGFGVTVTPKPGIPVQSPFNPNATDTMNITIGTGALSGNIEYYLTNYGTPQKVQVDNPECVNGIIYGFNRQYQTFIAITLSKS